MDLTASIMCMENKMPMMVFGLNEENSIVEYIKRNIFRNKSNCIKGGYIYGREIKSI